MQCNTSYTTATTWPRHHAVAGLPIYWQILFNSTFTTQSVFCCNDIDLRRLSSTSTLNLIACQLQVHLVMSSYSTTRTATPGMVKYPQTMFLDSSWTLNIRISHTCIPMSSVNLSYMANQQTCCTSVLEQTVMNSRVQNRPESLYTWW